MFKQLLFVALCIALVVAQADTLEKKTKDRERELANEEDPIGDFTLMVEGRITSAGKTVARVGGIMSRLTLPDEDTVLTTTILAAKAPKSKKQSRTSTNDEDQDENQNRMGRRDRQGQEQQDLAAVEDLSFAHTIGIQKAVNMDFYLISPETEGMGNCYHSSIDKEKAKLGRWVETDESDLASGKTCDGRLYKREITTKAERRGELFCKDEDQIYWIELTHSSNDVVVHYDVVQQDEAPQTDSRGLAMFALPAVCLVKTQETSEIVGVDQPPSRGGRTLKGAALGAVAGMASGWFFTARTVMRV